MIAGPRSRYEDRSRLFRLGRPWPRLCACLRSSCARGALVAFSHFCLRGAGPCSSSFSDAAARHHGVVVAVAAIGPSSSAPPTPSGAGGAPSAASAAPASQPGVACPDHGRSGPTILLLHPRDRPHLRHLHWQSCVDAAAVVSSFPLLPPRKTGAGSSSEWRPPAPPSCPPARAWRPSERSSQREEAGPRPKSPCSGGGRGGSQVGGDSEAAGGVVCSIVAAAVDGRPWCLTQVLLRPP